MPGCSQAIRCSRSSITVFRLALVQTTKPFNDTRFHEPLSLHLLYDATFTSGKFFEGQNGSLGFHYLLLATAVPAVMAQGMGLSRVDLPGRTRVALRC